MRQILEVLRKPTTPVGIVTKSALVARDIDILASMAERGLAKVALSVTTLDRRLARAMEPRAATPSKRIETIPETHRGRHSHHHHDGAHYPGAERHGAGAAARGGVRGRRAGRPVTSCSGYRWK
jgi:hypothetical protein